MHLCFGSLLRPCFPLTRTCCPPPPLRKPPCFLPGPGLEEGGQQLPQHHGRAVAVEFGAVLPGVAARPGESDRQPLVDDVSLGVQHLAEDQRPRRLA